MLLTDGLIILFLVALTALYVAAEFAAVSVSKARIKQYADEGSLVAQKLLPVVSDVNELDRYIAACQIGITLSSLILGAYGQVALSRALPTTLTRFFLMTDSSAQAVAAIVVLIGLTVFHMVLGELLPKALALRAPMRVALATLAPMLISVKLFSPFIGILNGSGHLVLRLLGLPPGAHGHVHTADEMALLFSESREGGLIGAEDHRRLNQALRLEHRKVSEIMVIRKEIEALEITSSYATVIQAMSSRPYTRWPVYEGSLDNVVGLAHARDVVKLALENASIFSLAQVVKPVLIVHEWMTAEDLLTRMRVERRQLAIVVDEFGTTVGLVGISDVLDEMMGDIQDSAENEGPTAQPLGDGRIRLPGTMRLDQASTWIGASWTSDQAVTVAGKILEELGRLPLRGEKLVINGVEVEIEHATRLAIQSVIVKPVPAAATPEARDA